METWLKNDILISFGKDCYWEQFVQCSFQKLFNEYLQAIIPVDRQRGHDRTYISRNNEEPSTLFNE